MHDFIMAMNVVISLCMVNVMASYYFGMLGLVVWCHDLVGYDHVLIMVTHGITLLDSGKCILFLVVMVWKWDEFLWCANSVYWFCRMVWFDMAWKNDSKKVVKAKDQGIMESWRWKMEKCNERLGFWLVMVG